MTNPGVIAVALAENTSGVCKPIRGPGVDINTRDNRLLDDGGGNVRLVAGVANTTERLNGVLGVRTVDGWYPPKKDMVNGSSESSALASSLHSLASDTVLPSATESGIVPRTSNAFKRSAIDWGSNRLKFNRRGLEAERISSSSCMLASILPGEPDGGTTPEHNDCCTGNNDS